MPEPTPPTPDNVATAHLEFLALVDAVLSHDHNRVRTLVHGSDLLPWELAIAGAQLFAAITPNLADDWLDQLRHHVITHPAKDSSHD
ncbi:hypothetical protein [Rhodococcus sp. AH-ZY2]|uniref:hypothetical protein n=1 Tax=Rhodococcus sp. AH-ZY2 TaxID=3047468 RepID=UPI0027E113BC|nr:hypothetical protein [Rhodococcus sp. AH-ZY2]WML64761.1 hypothetical protein QNA09_08215 [Rhodococcus sp. AH-ZY2]